MNIKSNFNKLNKNERQRFVLNTVINVIPYVGSTINDLFFELPNKIQQKRINETVELLTVKFEKLNGDYISKDYLKTDDFFDFTRSLFTTTVKIQSEEKRRILSNIYVKAIIDKNDFEFSKNSMFINFINDLSSIQIFILKYIQKYETDLKEIENYENFYNAFCLKTKEIQISQYEFKAHCSDLENKGLISMGSGLADFLDESEFIVASGHHKPSVIITNFGQEFINFLYE